jgi:hypothetical protein
MYPVPTSDLTRKSCISAERRNGRSDHPAKQGGGPREGSSLQQAIVSTHSKSTPACDHAHPNCSIHREPLAWVSAFPGTRAYPGAQANAIFRHLVTQGIGWAFSNWAQTEHRNRNSTSYLRVSLVPSASQDDHSQIESINGLTWSAGTWLAGTFLSGKQAGWMSILTNRSNSSGIA